MVVDTAVQTEIEQRRALAAQVLGEQELDHATTVQLDINRMLDAGVLVDIDIHGTSMFTTRTSWEELGVPQDDTRRKRLKRGSKDLIPKEYLGKLRSLENRFRQSLDKHSFVLEGFRPWRWVPFTAYQEWKAEWEELQGDLYAIKAAILENYDDAVDALAADFAEIARESWDAIRSRRPAGAGDFALVVPGHGAFESLDQFSDYVVSRAISQMPTREDIRHGLYVDYRNSLVATGPDLDEQLLRREQVKTQIEQERAAQHAAWQVAYTEEEAERAKRRQLELELREEEQQANLRMEAERQKIAAMKEAELEHARQRLETMTSPFVEVVEQFRARIYEDVTEIAASINKNGYLRGRVAGRARGLLDLYHLLGAATNDTELEQTLIELKAALGKAPADGGTKYDTGAVTAALRDIAEVTHEAAQNVAKRAGAHTRASALML